MTPAGSVTNFDFGAISEDRVSKNQWVMAAKKLMNENLRQSPSTAVQGHTMAGVLNGCRQGKQEQQRRRGHDGSTQVFDYSGQHGGRRW